MPTPVDYSLTDTVDLLKTSSDKNEAKIKLYNNITREYHSVSSEINSNLAASVNANKQAYIYKVRTQDVNGIQTDIINNQKTQNNIRVENAELAKRQYEINEWANSDKLDTLFVFQFVFISLLFVAFVEYLKKKGIVSSGFTYFLEFIVLIVNIMVIVIRSKYTRLLRDTRYWNKRKFNKYPPPIGNIDNNCVTNAIVGMGESTPAPVV